MKNIAVVFGGASVEHDVSIITGVKICKLFRRNFNIFPIYWGLDNKFYYLKNINFSYYNDKEKLMHLGKITEFVRGGIYSRNKTKLKFCANIDKVINCCHGGAGENGELSAFLKLNEITCNSGIKSSAVCNNKFIIKQIAKSLNVKTVNSVIINSNNIEEKLKHVKEFFSNDVIVKPNSLGSSIGILKTNLDNLKEIVELILHLDSQVIVEQYMENIEELRCAVIVHNNTLCYSQIEKIKTKNDIYSFEDKYFNINWEKELPAKISEETKLLIYQTIKKMHEVLNFCGVVEFQFFYNAKDNDLYFNEINTVPKNLCVELFEGLGINSKMIGEYLTEFDKGIKKQTYFYTDILHKIDL